ncbi:helix-hairpin-helix domain-containing protein [Desulfopila sp. IMCC35008]|uniref:ComEA family DNA-binding protein n=1 Tax=Desulfopila sp. IMCC35008 TaxID=2653858 RepID=UPI0013D525ED|nr:helix-hairpin-helix domain-containing protein [Desulfopila sp. IMCC35008]
MKNICLTLAIVFSLFISIPSLSVDSYAAKSATSATETVAKQAVKVDINDADVKLLSTIPGIGPKTAEAIVAYRKANGSFASIDDLVKVKGIGEKKLAKMKPFLKS